MTETDINEAMQQRKLGQVRKEFFVGSSTFQLMFACFTKTLTETHALVLIYFGHPSKSRDGGRWTTEVCLFLWAISHCKSHELASTCSSLADKYSLTFDFEK